MVRKGPEGGANPGMDCGLCGQPHVSDLHDVSRVEKSPWEKVHLHMPPGTMLANTRGMMGSSPSDSSYLHPLSPFQPGREFFDVVEEAYVFPCPLLEEEHGVEGRVWSRLVNGHVGVPMTVGFRGSCGCVVYENRFRFSSQTFGGPVMMQDVESGRTIFVSLFDAAAAGGVGGV